VSRTPVREALGRLAQDGLIERSTRGFRIRQRDPEQILEIYEARIALGGRSAELAAKRRTDFDLARMTHLLDERRATTDPAQFGPMNNRWHDALRLSAHNETVRDLLERLDSLLWRVPVSALTDCAIDGVAPLLRRELCPRGQDMPGRTTPKR
jgi:DNA-binding GntR family transcriptional regulator